MAALRLWPSSALSWRTTAMAVSIEPQSSWFQSLEDLLGSDRQSQYVMQTHKHLQSVVPSFAKFPDRLAMCSM